LGVNQTLRGCKKVTVTEKCQLPDPDSFSALLLTMIAMSGEFPMALGRRFSSPTYADFVVKRLKHNGLIRTYYRNGLRGLRLTAQAKKLLAASNPARFTPLFIGNTMTNAPKYTLVHRLRLHRMAEVLVAMFNAGMSVFPWEKPVVFNFTPLAEPPYIEQPAYYSSYELKRSIGEMANKIRGSRASGVLLTERDIFVVYNTGSSEMKWAYKAEVRLKALLQMELCQKRGPAQYADVKQSAILFGADMGRLLPMIGVDSDNNQNYFLSGQGFIHFYYLTCDHHGEVILQLLCDPDEKNRLDDLLAHGLSDPRPGWRVDNDAMDGDSPVLFGYTCDMPRIKRFDARLSQHELPGTLICFDFQEKALRRLCGPNVSFQCIDFDNYERSVFHQPQEFD